MRYTFQTGSDCSLATSGGWQLTSIRVIITGGTFDKEYDELAGALTFRDTHLPEIFRFVRCTVPLQLEINQLKDSLDMSAADRGRILESCRESAEEQIIVIHGTDTMVETADLLGRSSLDKRIVLTGAMVPYSIRNSDALFNLGTAVAAVQLVDTGVYIVMNGRIFSWDAVEKDYARGLFTDRDCAIR